MNKSAVSNDGQEVNETVPPFLTPRQREILVLLSQGKSNEEIARMLRIAKGTVKLHFTAILKALHVKTRTGAVMAASKLDFTAPKASGFGVRRPG